MKKVTIRDIAGLAGVSYSTVSRCLNGNLLVADKTRERVLRLAREHGFAFNANARNLSNRKTDVIGMVLPENFQNFEVRFYHMSLLNHVRDSLERMNYDLLTTFLSNRYSGQNHAKRLVQEGKIDGLILVQQSLSSETVRYFVHQDIPMIFSHFPVDYEGLSIANVHSDNITGGELVARRFLSTGRQHCLCFNSLPQDRDLRQRLEGFVRVFKAGGGTAQIMHSATRSFNAGYELAKTHENLLRQSDSLFAINDLMALGAMQALEEMGFKIPDDIAVIGYDDSELVRMCRTSLTSVNQKQGEVALLTCDKLIHRIKGQVQEKDFFQETLIRPELVIRESG